MLTIYRTTLFVLSLTVILPLKATTTVTGYLNEGNNKSLRCCRRRLQRIRRRIGRICRRY
ncbi:hypothetical protein J4732_08495 [Serratia marcescens]|uniref:Uncharacterized protein n=1 Tax=Serratia marcescens TaxID=615 RepID=A0A939NSY1_SERMA|nr:hypothetical protein [Serratia marcescens]